MVVVFLLFNTVYLHLISRVGLTLTYSAKDCGENSGGRPMRVGVCYQSAAAASPDNLGELCC